MTPQRQKIREDIRTEMIREVIRLWNYDASETGIESFDPLVGMLIGAFATGLEGVQNELQNSRTRIIERLAKLIVPDAVTGTQPAHAIMKTRIIDPNYEVLPSHVFMVNHAGKESYFSPAGHFNLSNIRISTVLHQNRVREQIPALKESYINHAFEPNLVWIGLEIDADVQNLENIPFFFDWRNDTNRNQYLERVSDTNFSIEDVPISYTTGFWNANAITNITDATNVSEQQNRNIQKWYQRHFIRVSAINRKTKAVLNVQDFKKKIPTEVSNYISAEESAKFFQKELLWIKLNFPGGIPADAIGRAMIEVNAFPVINRKPCVDNFDLKPVFNVFPVRVEDGDNFLDMVEVETPSGAKLSVAHQTSRSDSNYYILKQGGVTRFDERDGQEMVAYITTLLRDESAMFSSLGRTELESEIDEIRRRLEKINTGITQNFEQTGFVMVRSNEKTGRLALRYWTTRGEAANNIPLGTKLMRDKSNRAFADDDTVFLTPTSGGKQRVQSDELLSVFKKTILTRGRVVTEEDIRAVCFAALGDKINEVEISKGYEMGEVKAVGLVRTIKVKLRPNPSKNLNSEQWGEACYQLQKNLEQQSTGVLPFAVFV